MKVFQVLNNFLPQQIAGTEIYTWALGKELEQKEIEVEVIIPGYGQQLSSNYEFDKIQVYQFAEPSIVDRSLIMGFKQPLGVTAFKDHLTNVAPDIVHFQELAGSNGITIHHVYAAKQAGAKVIMTFHLAKYTCKTGTLMYMGKELCDGKIDIKKCSKCYLETKKIGRFSKFLLSVSTLFYKLGINTLKYNNKVATAMATPFLIEDLSDNFIKLVSQCDKVVVLTKWYEKILLFNGVPQNKIHFIPQGLAFPIQHTPSCRTTALPIRLIFLGRISPFKGLHLLLTALQGISENTIQLDIYGHNADSEYEEKWRYKTITNKNIRWLGKLAQDKVVGTMKSYDVLCLCSTFSEMSPLVIQEAFTAGLPVLASDVYGNAEQIIEGVNGWLFKFNDSDNLKNKLIELITDPTIFEQAKRHITPVNSFKTVADAYSKIYEEMLTGL